MTNYKVFNVGDALFSVFVNEKRIESVFDFGSSNKKEFQEIRQYEYENAETFVLSHFHSDHYINFTFCQDNSLNITELIIPKLPDDPVIQDSMKAFMTIQLYYLGDQTGFYESDLLNLIRKKNQNDFSVTRVSRSDTFPTSCHNFKVLWPDFNYLSRLKSIKTALNNFNKVTSKNKLFGEFHEQVKDSSFWKSEYVTTLSEKINDGRIRLTEEQKEQIKAANKFLLRLANDICLAFESENEILFLGDLSTRALNSLFRSDFKLNKEYVFILSAHHGTHSSIYPNWKNVKANVVITSGGQQRFEKFKKEYLLWSKIQHHTYCHGNFNSIRYLRHCKINKIEKNHEHQRT